jgi:hypothetical protein
MLPSLISVEFKGIASKTFFLVTVCGSLLFLLKKKVAKEILE